MAVQRRSHYLGRGKRCDHRRPLVLHRRTADRADEPPESSGRSTSRDSQFLKVARFVFEPIMPT